MLSKAEIEEELIAARLFVVESPLVESRILAHNCIKALETAQQLGEWLEYLWFTHDDEKTYSDNSLISNWLKGRGK